MTRLDLFGSVPFRLNRLAAEASRCLVAVHAERLGIDVAKWQVLATLGQKAPLTLQAIARSTGMHEWRGWNAWATSSVPRTHATAARSTCA